MHRKVNFRVLGCVELPTLEAQVKLKPNVIGKLSHSINSQTLNASKERIAKEIEKSFNRSKTPLQDEIEA